MSAEKQQSIPWNFHANSRSSARRISVRNDKPSKLQLLGTACLLLPALVVVVPFAGYSLDRVLTLFQDQFQLFLPPLAGDSVRHRRQHCITSFTIYVQSKQMIMPPRLTTPTALNSNTREKCTTYGTHSWTILLTVTASALFYILL